MKERTKKAKIRVLLEPHILEAATVYLRSLSLIDDNEEVVRYKKVPEGIEVDIEKETTNED